MFCIAFRARVAPEATYPAWFTHCEAAAFWPTVERAYDELVTRGEWYEPAFEWAVTQVLRRSAPLTRRNMDRLLVAYKAHQSPVYSLVPPSAPPVKAPVRSLTRDFEKLGQRPVKAVPSTATTAESAA